MKARHILGLKHRTCMSEAAPVCLMSWSHAVDGLQSAEKMSWKLKQGSFKLKSPLSQTFYTGRWTLQAEGQDLPAKSEQSDTQIGQVKSSCNLPGKKRQKKSNCLFVASDNGDTHCCATHSRCYVMWQTTFRGGLTFLLLTRSDLKLGLNSFREMIENQYQWAIPHCP